MLFSALNTASAGPFDFLKRIGDSIAHPHPSQTPARSSRKGAAKNKGTKSTEGTETVVPFTTAPDETAAPSATPIPTPTDTPVPTRVAVAAPSSSVIINGRRRDLPYGVPVPDRAGFVVSPYAPNAGFVDVRNFESGTEVKDPYTGKIFITP